jgi:ubiquitin carboxyl-terminal hydrolase 6/32
VHTNYTTVLKTMEYKLFFYSGSPSNSPLPMRRNIPNSTCPRPGPIDNNPLVVTQPVGGGNKIPPLTAEGGKLRRSIGLVRGRDYQLLPQALWKALEQWYGGTPALPRQVIIPREGAEPELELYPLVLKVMRHQIPPRPPNQQQTWSDMVGGYGAAALGNFNLPFFVTARMEI